MSVRYLVICDGCAETAPRRSERNLKNARAFNRTLGWTHPKPGVDLCKSCSEATTNTSNPTGGS